QHLKVTINRVALSLLINFTRLEDDEGSPIGFVLVFDNLAEATQRVSEGDFDFEMQEVSNDEIGQLVNSFNVMTANINSSNKKLADTHSALEKSSQESEQRRRYMEIILQNVSAGVVSLDDNGRITTINRFAENLLKIDSSRFIGMNYRQALPREYSHILDRFIEELYATGKSSIEQHLKAAPEGNHQPRGPLFVDQFYST
ncbi:MAG: HAMP domain-containing protein, partial [Deltaproteobacteria bacterium]|nr:HAMP domain-containing protein [Deltaproteobacteria bacterium]